MRVTDEARPIIETALKFANWGPIHSTTQVKLLFFKLAIVGNIDLVRDSPTKDKGVYERAQTGLRRWLTEIAGKGVLARESIGVEINEHLGRVPATLSFEVEGEFKNRLVHRYQLKGVQMACAFAVGLILDKGRGLTNHLGYCKAPGCGKFRLDFKGKPRRYCNEEHRRLFDAVDAKERMRRKRLREKHKKAKQREGPKDGTSRTTR